MQGVQVREFDLIVLGGGSGGLATAQRAAEYGAEAIVFEPGRLGGTCVNVGCVPKKIMWSAAELAQAIRHAPDYGFNVHAIGGHDWGKLKSGRDAYVARLNGIYARNLERKSIPVVASRGRFVAAREIADDQGQLYTAPHIVIATGGYPLFPTIPGAQFGISSDGFFELAALPARVAVVGSGYIAVELAGVLQTLGSRVSLFMRRERLLRNFDPLLADRLMESMQSAGIDLVGKATPKAVRGPAPLSLETEAGDRFDGFDQLIWAIGRAPNTRDLGLEHTAVTIADGGHVVVDEFQATREPGVYALGDVTGQAELTPVAIAAGRRLADRVFDGQAGRKLSYDVVPTVIFSHPPIGTIGLSEQAAKTRYGAAEIRTYTADFVPMFHALTDAKPKTAMKLVTVGAEERIIGCHVIGPGADEMTQGFAVAMTMGACKRDFDDTIAIHPTSAEELVTMR
jgi:glutathione reductase (NADPH)